MALKKAAAAKKAAASKAPSKKAAAKAGSNFYGRITPKGPTSPASSGRPTRKGRASRNEPDTFEKDLVFVGMSFVGDGMAEVFSAIRDVCASLKLKARRVDDNHTSGFIILEIVDLIERAEFLIFDLTFERPNVYYELGYAHGVGNAPSNILLIAKEGTATHFDITPLRIHYYPNTEKLRQTLKVALKTLMTSTRVS